MQEHKSIQVQEAQEGELVEDSSPHTPVEVFIRPARAIDPQTGKLYAELKRTMKQKGLFDPQPRYYALSMLGSLALLVAAIIFLFAVNNFWLQLLNAVFCGFVYTQIAFFSHDIGHRQVFRTTWKADVVNLLVSNVLLGLSGSWWIDRHNQHHSHPNQFELDPDIDIPFISFTVEEARNKARIVQFIVKYQAYFFFPTQVFVMPGFRILSIRFLLQKKARNTLAEACFLLLHPVLYWGLLFTCLNIWQAIVFMLVHQAVLGLYLGSVFAPNHKGMPMLERDSSVDFLHRQVLTSRNVRPHPLTDFWYGGLNYQIEHHLFPTVARNKLKEAQRIVKAFCQSHGIAYYETGPLQSYKEILHCLHQASAPLREA